MKTILKFAYLAFALVIGFMVGFFGYYSNGYNYYASITKSAIDNKDYVELAKIHGGCFAKENLGTANDNVEVVIMSSAVDYSVTTYAKGSDDTYTESSTSYYENGYYFYVLHPNFQNDNYKKGDATFNKTAIRFLSATGSFDYYFNLNSEVNNKTAKYTEKPATVKEALLYGSRTTSNFYEAYGFYNFDISKTLVEAIESEIGDITGYAIVNSLEENEAVLTSTFNFDFSQQFFTDVEPLITNYNKYLTDSKAGVEGAADTFSNWYNGTDGTGFIDSFVKMHDGAYSFRHEDGYLQPSSIIWQTVGICTLYLLLVAIIYILLFHFNLLKKLFRLIAGKKDSSEEAPRQYKNKPQVIDAEVSYPSIKPIRAANKQIQTEVKPVEEAKEEVVTDVESTNEEVATETEEETKETE